MLADRFCFLLETVFFRIGKSTTDKTYWCFCIVRRLLRICLVVFYFHTPYDRKTRCFMNFMCSESVHKRIASVCVVCRFTFLFGSISFLLPHSCGSLAPISIHSFIHWLIVCLVLVLLVCLPVCIAEYVLIICSLASTG